MTPTRGSAGPVLVGLAWALGWAGFAALWVAFVSQIVVVRLWTPGFWALAAVAILPAIPVGCLARRCSRRFPLSGVTARALLGAAVLAAGALVLARPSSTGIALAGYAFAGPFCLALSGAALRLGWPRASLWAVGLLYLVVGLLLLIPVPPISAHTYNPVGLFFPFWGAGAPACAIIAGLTRFLKEETARGPSP